MDLWGGGKLVCFNRTAIPLATGIDCLCLCVMYGTSKAFFLVAMLESHYLHGCFINLES